MPHQWAWSDHYNRPHKVVVRAQGFIWAEHWANLGAKWASSKHQRHWLALPKHCHVILRIHLWSRVYLTFADRETDHTVRKQQSRDGIQDCLSLQYYTIPLSKMEKITQLWKWVRCFRIEMSVWELVSFVFFTEYQGTNLRGCSRKHDCESTAW